MDYYGRYTCKAENPHGKAQHEIDFREARYGCEYFFVKKIILIYGTSRFFFLKTREPSYVQQAITDKITATTIQGFTYFFIYLFMCQKTIVSQFRFVAPTDTGGLPIESYSVEYKVSAAGADWGTGRRRTWPAADNGVYILENLQPRTTYDFRFAAKNLVGFSEFAASQQVWDGRRFLLNRISFVTWTISRTDGTI